MGEHSPVSGAFYTFPYEGKGDRLRWMRSREHEGSILQIEPSKLLLPVHCPLSTDHSISNNVNSEKLTDMGLYPVEYNCNPYPPVVKTVSSTVISNVSLA